MKKLLILTVLMLSGCAQWNELSDQEKGAVIISASVLAAASIIKNSNDQNVINNCISTRSLETGCGDKF